MDYTITEDLLSPQTDYFFIILPAKIRRNPIPTNRQNLHLINKNGWCIFKQRMPPKYASGLNGSNPLGRAKILDLWSHSCLGENCFHTNKSGVIVLPVTMKMRVIRLGTVITTSQRHALFMLVQKISKTGSRL